MSNIPLRNPAAQALYSGGVFYGDRFDWYSQRDDIVGNAVGMLTPLRLLTGGVGTPQRIYQHFAPVLVTVDVNIQVTNPGAGGPIAMQVFPVWGGIQGNNVAFSLEAVANNALHFYCQLQVFTHPAAPSPITIQWQVVGIPAGAVVTIKADQLAAGSHYYVRYLRNQLFGEARI